MKNYTSRFFLLFALLLLIKVTVTAQSGTTWNRKTAAKWFKTQEWLKDNKGSESGIKYDQFGRAIEAAPDTDVAGSTGRSLQQLKAHPSIDIEEFARQYHAHKMWWNKAFAYLRNTDLANLAIGDHPIVGEDVFARVTEAPLKKLDSSKWEAHKNYADIHYVIKGREKIGIGPLSTAKLVEPYNSKRDISFYEGTGMYYIAEPGTYFIAFPHQIHRPGLEVKGKETEKKIVIKVRTSN